MRGRRSTGDSIRRCGGAAHALEIGIACEPREFGQLGLVDVHGLRSPKQYGGTPTTTSRRHGPSRAAPGSALPVHVTTCSRTSQVPKSGVHSVA